MSKKDIVKIVLSLVVIVVMILATKDKEENLQIVEWASNESLTVEEMQQVIENQNRGKNKVAYTKEQIDEIMAANEVENKLWSPSGKTIVFSRPGDSRGGYYIWSVGDNNETIVGFNGPNTTTFIWSPDDKYFVVNRVEDEETQVRSRLVDVEKLEMIEAKFKSNQEPIWNKEGNELIISNYDDEKNLNRIQIYSIASKSFFDIVTVKGQDVNLKIDSWDEAGDIYYSETRDGIMIKKVKNDK